LIIEETPMATITKRMTVEEYLALPEDEKPYREFVDGEILEKVMGQRRHSYAQQFLAEEMGAYRRAHGGNAATEGRVRFETVRGREFRLPDLAYWAPGKPSFDGTYLLPPTLAIEIRSPGESMADQRAKCRYFREHGVDAVWLIDVVSRTAEPFEDGVDGEAVPSGGALTAAAVPGLRVELAELWRAIE
jgi:Uma2 family endonuclease